MTIAAAAVATVATASCVYRREFEIGTANSILSVLPVSRYFSHLIKIENANRAKKASRSRK